MGKQARDNVSVCKIDMADLRVGMYIHDLNCGWMEHPFLRTRFLVKNDRQVEQLQELGLAEIYIDTSRGLAAEHSLDIREVEQQLDLEIAQLLESSPPPALRVDLSGELPRAERLLHEANHIVRKILSDCRLGLQLEMGPLEEIVGELTQSVLRNATALSILSRIKQRDDYTFQHSVNVGILMLLFESYRSNSVEDMMQAGIGGMVHDIGKTKIPLAILNKPGKLNEAEFEIMKRHATYSGDILAGVKDISWTALEIATQHHERFDGSGYPHGLSCARISPAGQAAAIIDVYDALTSERCYHTAMSAPVALRKILEWSRHHFNPELARSFIRAIGIYPVGTLVLLESGRLAVVTEQNETDLTRPRVRAFFSCKSQCYIHPISIDLASPFGLGGGDRIVRHEDPHHWGVDPSRFLAWC